MPTKQRCKKIRNREQEQEWNFYSNLRTNPQLYEKKKKRKEKKTSFDVMRILNSQVWAQGLFCDMLTKRKIFFSRHLPSFFHFHGKLFQGASWKATQNQCVLKATSLMTDKRVMREFLHLLFNRDLEKPNDWERAWFILCKC